MIDVTFNVYSDTPEGKDPDSWSETLRKYHQVLWSKDLSSGMKFELDTDTQQLLHHKSTLGEFYLSSDSIGHTYSKTKSMHHIIKNMPPEDIDAFFGLCSTIGAYIIYPSKRVDNKMTFNGARGVDSKIKDRFDLSLECIRRYYQDEESPLSATITRYKEFFDLYRNFKEYINFYLLQDLVDDKCSSINFFLPFSDFNETPLPDNIEKYIVYKNNVTKFVTSRNKRILDWSTMKFKRKHSVTLE